MRRNLAFACLLLAAATSMAQAPAPPSNTNTQAIELATRLGRERSAEGLETILRGKNVDLLSAYDRGFRETGMRLYTERGNKAAPMPADVEAVMLLYYTDPVVGGRLPGLCVGTACQTRELFGLMLAELRTGKFRGSDYDLREAVLRSQASGAEAALTAWLDAADAPTGSMFNSVVQSLGLRKYGPAVPTLAARLARGDPAQSSAIEYALIRIETPAAIDALLARMAALKVSQVPTAAQQLKSLADSLAQIGPEVPIPYDRFRAALPPDTRQYAITWLTKRKDLKAVPDAIALLGDRATFSNAVSALIATDSPEVWKQARAEVERLKKEGKVEDYLYRSGSTSLDAKIADPAKHMAEKAAIDRGREYESHRSLLARDRAAAMKLRAAEPEGYVTGMKDYLKSAEKLAGEYAGVPTTVGAKGEMANDYLELAHWVRFKSKRPKEAIELYEGAQRNGSPLGLFGAGDTLQFDLRDPQGALAEYRKIPAASNPSTYRGGGEDDMMAEWGRKWLVAQEAWLTKGQRFSGPIGERDLGPVTMFAYVAGGGGPDDVFGLGPLGQMMARAAGGQKVDRDEVKRALDKLPPSGFVLIRTMGLISLMPDSTSILEYLARHDPAGFASASYFGLVEFALNSPDPRQARAFAPGMDPKAGRDPLREAKARFVKERRVDLAPIAKQAKPDPRMSSPQATWDLFVGSLRRNDLDEAMNCLTPQMQQRFKPLFSKMTPAERREAADSFKAFKVTTGYGEYQEAMVVRGSGNAGVVTFANVNGSWKIAEM
jgi:hypothetical protein